MSCEITVAVAAPRHSPFKVEDKDRSEDDIGNYRHHRCKHCFLRIPGSAHHIVQSYHCISNRSSQQDYLHETACVWKCVVTGTEKQQDIIEKDKGQYSEEDRIGDTKHKRV